MPAVSFNGKGLCGGRASGPALVSRASINFTAAFTKPPNILPSRRSQMCDKHHDFSGQDVKGQVLIFPSAVGSTHTGLVILDLVRQKIGPAAMVVTDADPLLLSGILLSEVWYGHGIPVVEYKGDDIYDAIETGVTVEVNGDTGDLVIPSID